MLEQSNTEISHSHRFHTFIACLSRLRFSVAQYWFTLKFPSFYLKKTLGLTGDPGLGAFVDDGMPERGHFPLNPGSQAIDVGNSDVQ